ncbi:hypothetical protein MANY_15790 [Mycolicibacterium anyangense]|uniref:PE-PGRS family protein n=1 Tax=Mycolicibacterium anyangense TaxID=1431246 RepID=A0A6N4W865_9MYCO|nr:hypothetical protein [Mycolicibacterium anyangense]BBZ76242.1 hypothetical protein MANY_15790 [Mycolicibacterium anyangense]
MQISLRSQLIAGVAVVGASAIAITPITQPNVIPTVHAPAIQNVAFDNPFIVFGPVLEHTVYDISSLISGPVADPLPILRTFAVNQIGNATNLLTAAGALGVGLGASLWNVPGGVVTATAELLKGDVQGAITALQTALIEPIAVELTDFTIPKITAVVNQTIQNLTALVNVVPSQVLGIINATVNAVSATIQATIATGQQFANNLQTLNLEGMWNSIIDGTLGTTGILDTLRATTIGGGPSSISSAIGSAINNINVAIGGPATQLPQPSAALTSSKIRAAAATTPALTSVSAAESAGAAGSKGSGSSDSGTAGDAAGSTTKSSATGGSRRAANAATTATTAKPATSAAAPKKDTGSSHSAE